MKKWLGSMLTLLAIALAVAACGEDDEGSGEGAGRTEAPADTGAASAGAVKVGMEDIEYVPDEVKVKAGRTVRWTNSDSLTHTVTKQSGPGGKFDSGRMEVGATFEQKFDKPGKVNYFCTIHPNQEGTVTVTR